jgi:hypothetical protein
MTDQLPTDASASKSKRNRRLSFLVLLGCIVGWFFCGDAIREFIDREMVRNVQFDPDGTKLQPGARPGSLNRLILPKGKWVKAGPDVICYGRALGHHALFGFRRGHSYVQVNGKVYGKESGPCGSTQSIQLAVDSMDSDTVVTEDVVVQALAKERFTLIP